MSKKAKIFAVVMAAALALTGCGGSSGGSGAKGDKGIKDLVTFETSNREMENLFIINSEMSADLNVLCNVNEGLLETDSKGQLIPGVAESWEHNDDSTQWTFHLREGVKWVDVNGQEKADCTAQDWITSLEWIMNFHKNGAANTSMPTALIKGAGDYYEYTKGLSEAEATSMDNSKFLEMVGIEAPDDYTLVYTCPSPAPYFDTVCVSACLYPLSQAFVDEVGVANVLGSNNETLWYNGPYTLTSFIQGNEKILTKNPLYWDTECSLFDTVTIRIVEDTTVGFQLYQNGEMDHMDLSAATLKTIAADENNEFYDQLVEKRPRKYSYQMHLNYDKRFADGSKDENWNKAVANENFRKALYYGLDLTEYWARTNALYPVHCENTTYTMKGLLYYSDGTDYTDKVDELTGMGKSDGEHARRYDADKAAEYKEAAMKELKDAGVTFPINVDYFCIAGDQNAQDTATVLQKIFEQSLGTDFVKFNIGTYVSSQTQEVVQPRLQSFVTNGWGADYGDVQNYLGQETYGEDTAYYSMNYSNINDAKDKKLIATYKEFTELVNKANAITDNLDARYDAYAEAEAFMLEHALSIPAQLEVSWQLTHVNDFSRSNAMYGIQNYMYKNWETSVDAYTTEDYNAFAEEFAK